MNAYQFLAALFLLFVAGIGAGAIYRFANTQRPEVVCRLVNDEIRPQLSKACVPDETAAPLGTALMVTFVCPGGVDVYFSCNVERSPPIASYLDNL